MYFFFAVKGKVQEIMILSILCQWRSRHSCFGGLFFSFRREIFQTILNLVFLFLCALLLSEEKENQNDYGWEKSLQKGKFEH